MDMSCVSTCSIALNHLPAEKAFEIIAAAGYRKVDVHEKVHLSEEGRHAIHKHD